MSLETTRERKEKGGERGEKKKGLLALIIFILPTLEIVSERQKSARDTPLGHLNRAVPFSKIRVYIYIYIYIIRKHLLILQSNPKSKELFPPGSIIPSFRRSKILKNYWHHLVLKQPKRVKQFNKAMAVSNAKGIDAIFVEISLLNPNHFLACRRAKNTPFIQDFLVILKM